MFELDLLIKEANELIQNDEIKFELAPSKGGAMVKVIRHNQWATYLKLEDFKEKLEEMRLLGLAEKSS